MSTKPGCVKCGFSTTPTPHYHKGEKKGQRCTSGGWNSLSPVAEEHLRYDCPCGFAWTKPCEDANERKCGVHVLYCPVCTPEKVGGTTGNDR